MDITRQNYSRKFKLHTVQRYAAGVESMAQIERERDITPGLLSKWRVQYLPELLAISPVIDSSSIHLATENEDEANFRPQRIILVPSTAIPIWTQTPIDKPDWAQFYGHTVYSYTQFMAGEKYLRSDGVHTGLDWGKSFTPGQQYPVFAACQGEVIKIDRSTTSYKPGLVIIKPKNYSRLKLFYGHLQDIQVDEKAIVGPQTKLGILDPGEEHVHIEIRREDNSYINPYPFLGPDLKKVLFSYKDKDKATRYVKHIKNPIPAWGSYS
jgi:transposase-like protein